VLFWQACIKQSRTRKGTHILWEEITVLRLTTVWELLICHFLVGQLFHITEPDVRLTTNSLVLVCTIILALESSYFHSMKQSVFLFPISVILLNSPLNYSHMQQQANWSTQTLRGNLVLGDSTKLPVLPNVASTEQQVCTQCHMYLH